MYWMDMIWKYNFMFFIMKITFPLCHKKSHQCCNELQCTSQTCQFTNFSKSFPIPMERFNSAGGRNSGLWILHYFHKVFISTLWISLRPHSYEFYSSSKQTSTKIIIAAKKYQYQTRTHCKNFTSSNSSG